MKAAALVVSGLCQVVINFTQYTISEYKINQALEKRSYFSRMARMLTRTELTTLPARLVEELLVSVTLFGDAAGYEFLFGSVKSGDETSFKSLCRSWIKKKGAIYFTEAERQTPPP